jgi:hypothetical protein
MRAHGRSRWLVLATATLWATTILTAGRHSGIRADHRAGGSGHLEPQPQNQEAGRPLLWREPAAIGRRDLFYGPGGKEHQPRGPFTFIKEDLNGSKPKFGVRDETGMNWKIKLGAEARPETVASRLVWAMGYFADEDYFVPQVTVREMPSHVHRGQRLIGPDGTMHDVRMKREPDDRDKIGNWQWGDNPFKGTRQLNGLRVLMAVINNWDLKDDNNEIHRQRDGGRAGTVERLYEVSDLGSSFGSAGLERTDEESEGNLRAYSRSQFIKNVEADEVNFNVPRRPALIVLFNPRQFFSRLAPRAIGRHVPRKDAKWIGHMLAQLSIDQLRSAFRAAGYAEGDIEGFTRVLQARIALLDQL